MAVGLGIGLGEIKIMWKEFGGIMVREVMRII